MNDDIILYWVLGILIWGFIWGIITQSVSSSKGYDGGFAWGFLLGFIGLIVVACKPDNRQTYYQRPNYAPSQVSTGSKSVVFCRSCGTDNSSNSTHCQSCGAKLSPAVFAQKTGKEGQWKCKCGAQNYSYETSCHRCGEKKPFSSANSDKKTSSTSVSDSKSITEQLEELKKLQEQGLITEADFDAKKKQILKL